MELSLNCVKTSKPLVSHLINNLPAYILVCSSLSAGIQPQTAFRPTARGLGQKARLPVLASHWLLCTLQFLWHGCSLYIQSAILQNECCGSHGIHRRESNRGYFPSQGPSSPIRPLILRQLRKHTDVMHWWWSCFTKTSSAQATFSWRLKTKAPLVTGGTGPFPNQRFLELPKSSFQLCPLIPSFFWMWKFALDVACWFILT